MKFTSVQIGSCNWQVVMWKLLNIIVIRSVLADYGFIRGRNCGIGTPVSYVNSLKPWDDIDKMKCVFVRDKGSFDKFYKSKQMGT